MTLFWNKRTITTIVTAACLAFVFLNSAYPAYATDEMLVGRWIYMEGTDHDNPVNMELLKDGSGIVDRIGITWKTEIGRFYIFHPQKAEAWDYELSGSTLTLSTDDGETLKYIPHTESKAERERIAKLVGSWSSVESINNLRTALTMRINMELFKDKSGIISGNPITWKIENDRIYISNSQGELLLSGSYELSDSKLSLTKDDGNIKLFMPPAEAEEEEERKLAAKEKAIRETATDEEKHSVAVAQIREIQNALDIFYLHNGFYPTTEQGLNALVTKPTTNPQPKRYIEGGYMIKVPLDPWGNPFVYRSPGVKGLIDIISYGPDGVEETGNNITNHDY